MMYPSMLLLVAETNNNKHIKRRDFSLEKYYKVKPELTTAKVTRSIVRKREKS